MSWRLSCNTKPILLRCVQPPKRNLTPRTKLPTPVDPRLNAHFEISLGTRGGNRAHRVWHHAQMTAIGCQLEKRRLPTQVPVCCWAERMVVIGVDVQIQLPAAATVCPPESLTSNYLRCARPADHVGGGSSTAETAFSQTPVFWRFSAFD